MAPSRFIAVFSRSPAQLHEVAPLLSPHVEICCSDGLLLEVPPRYEQDTLHRLSHLVDRNAKIGGASSRTAAIFAAKAHPGTIIPYGKEKDFLSSLPIHLLSIHTEVEDKLLTTLHRWGVKTLGELAGLPKKALVARLGQQGRLLQRIARGEDTQLFPPLLPESQFEENRELEWALDSFEPLSFILSRMLENLCSRLKSCGLAMEALRVKCKLTDESVYERDIKFALPMQDPKVILSLVRLELQTYSPSAGITALSIRAESAKPRVFQHSLLQPTAPHPEKLSRTLRRLAVLVGEENMGCPKVLNTHCPDAFQIEPLILSGKMESKQVEAGAFAQLTLRRFRPAKPTDIQTERIVHCAGPWRSSGNWWGQKGRAGGWAREEWDVELNDGGIYRVYWDQIAKRWFLEGVYD
jgi:protein ImuB